MTGRRQVIVVGAGISGLTTAYRLAREGVDVEVFEARDRVGGRAWRIPVGEAAFDAGCEALDHEHATLLRVADEVGVATLEAPAWEAEPPLGLEGEDAELFQAFETEIASLAARIDPAHPEHVDGAGALDGQTLAGWLDEAGASAKVLRAAELWISIASSSVPLSRMSLLGYAAKLAAGAAPTGLRLRFEGGPSALAERLVEQLAGRIQLGRAVVAVGDDGTGVSLTLADGSAEHADHLVLAVPLTVQRELRFDPPLPEYRRLALEEACYGTVVKQAALVDGSGRLELPFLSEDGHIYRSAHEPNLVVRFGGADSATREFDFGRFLNEPPKAEASADWSQERWTRGSYVILGPGHLTSWGVRLGEPHGRVHFGGVERSTLKSYMEGAARGGEEVAAEVLEAVA
jgi:monoamine oxidase